MASAREMEQAPHDAGAEMQRLRLHESRFFDRFAAAPTPVAVYHPAA